jgi:acyl dehydratase
VDGVAHAAADWRMRGPLLYLDDLSVGQTFQSASRTITSGEIKHFAAEYDPQPFHLDDAAAEQSIFGGLAASGWHTAAITMRLIVDSVNLAGGVIGAGGTLAWPRPTRPGDTLQVTSTILEITPSRSKPDRGIVKLRIETRNQLGEVVQDLAPTLIVRRRPGPGR